MQVQYDHLHGRLWYDLNIKSVLPAGRCITFKTEISKKPEPSEDEVEEEANAPIEKLWNKLAHARNDAHELIDDIMLNRPTSCTLEEQVANMHETLQAFNAELLRLCTAVGQRVPTWQDGNDVCADLKKLLALEEAAASAPIIKEWLAKLADYLKQAQFLGGPALRESCDRLRREVLQQLVDEQKSKVPRWVTPAPPQDAKEWLQAFQMMEAAAQLSLLKDLRAQGYISLAHLLENMGGIA